MAKTKTPAAQVVKLKLLKPLSYVGFARTRTVAKKGEIITGYCSPDSDPAKCTWFATDRGAMVRGTDVQVVH
jgi:hypothetical protein